MSQQPKNYFSSKLGLILSVLGIAVGTGNFWRFPRMAAQNAGVEGAGAFVIAWACCLFLFSIPLIIAEYGIGRHGRKGVIGSFIKLVGKKFAWLGSFIAFVATAIMFYYSVVAGWCLYYFIQSVGTELPANLQQAEAVWYGFQGTVWPIILHAFAMGLGGLIVVKGVSSIEKVNKILIPSLVVVVIISLIRALTLPGSFEGVQYLFTPDWSMLSNPEIWLEALSQNAWDTGAGWGLIICYGAYMRMQDDITMSAFQTGIGNNLVSLSAGIIIFATVFGSLGSTMTNAEILDIMQNSGAASSALTFMWLPQLFADMAGGRIFAIIFFLGLTFAAFSSLIAMIELASRTFVDVGVTKKKATIGVCIAGFLFGIPSALSTSILVNQDTVWGIGLLISGAFIAFAVIKFHPAKFRAEVVNVKERKYTLGRWWDLIIKYVLPIEVISLIAWWIFQSASVEGWYNPISTFSLATVMVQLGLAMILFYLFNDRIAEANSD